MYRLLKLILWHLLILIVFFAWAAARNKGNYNANLPLASLYFTLMCTPVFYTMLVLVEHWFTTVNPKWKLYVAFLVLYLCSIPYGYVFVYSILPSVDVYFFNPKGTFTWLAFIGTITIQFVIFLLIAILVTLVKKYGAMLVEFVKMKLESKTNGFQYQLKGHVDGKLLSFVANVEAENGNWENYELISKMQTIKEYIIRVHQSGLALVPLEEEWDMLVKMVESIHIREGRHDLISLVKRGEWSNQMIPAFTLLTYMENIEEYTCFTSNETVLVVLELDEDGFSYYSKNRINTKNRSGSSEGRGNGLLLVKERLELLLPNQYELKIIVEEGYYIVNLNVRAI